MPQRDNLTATRAELAVFARFREIITRQRQVMIRQDAIHIVLALTQLLRNLRQVCRTGRLPFTRAHRRVFLQLWRVCSVNHGRLTLQMRALLELDGAEVFNEETTLYILD